MAKYETREYLYLDSLRVNLFRLAYNLSSADSKQLLKALVQTLKPSDANAISESFRLETNLLEMMKQRSIFPGRPFLEICKNLPDENWRRFLLFLPSLSCKFGRLGKGKCVVLSQERYGGPRYKVREGTERDVEELTRTFERFDCEVEVMRDCSASEIAESFRKLGM